MEKGILDRYREEVEKDEARDDKNFIENSLLTEAQREEYEKTLNELRNNTSDIRNAYEEKKRQMLHYTEDEFDEMGKMKDENVRVVVRHVYCPKCGEELISKAPPLFNPFTFEKICKHECTKCGTVFNLDHAYPRNVFVNEENKEVKAFGL